MPLMLKEYVTRLDTDQQKAVLADPAPLLVMAGAGSGKTALLTSRVAHMIDTGVASPEKILVSAFTRVAANEMQERVQSLTDCSNLVVGTFHSIMFKFLNDYRAASGRKPYGVCKEGPKKIFFQGILDKPSKNYPQGLNLEADLGNVMAIIGRWKNSCIVADGPEVRQTADEAPRNTDEYAAAKAYPLYEEWLASQNLIDFDDMLLKTWVLLTVDPNALSEARARWDAFFVDECQDTNVVQFKLLELIAPPTSQPNITLVGDLRQCQPAGTNVTVIDRPGRAGLSATFKEVPIEDVAVGDRVVSYDISNTYFHKGIGREVTGVAQRSYEGPLVTVEVAGRRSRYTPDHRVVARMGDSLKGKWVVYLMRRGSSYRVGQARGMYESQGGQLGFVQRINHEDADAGWILSVHDSASEASLHEALTSWTWQIPSLRFKRGSGERMTQAETDLFWEKMGDLTVRAEACLAAHGRLIGHPLFDRGSNRDGWAGNGGRKMLLRRRATVIAAANLLDGMEMLPFVDTKGKSAHRKFWAPAKVSTEWYSGTVHSLEVEEFETYVADGITTHNCLYSFRGAAPELVTWFEERWKAQRIDLINNYRSVHEIVSAANQLAGNMGMKDQKSTRGTGNSPVVQEFNDVYDQALGIVEDVADLREQGMKGGDIAILTRTNAQSAPIESAFVKAGLPYWSSGGGFFDLMEVGDLIAYLRLANERTNVDLLERIINRPTRYLGKAFAHAVAEKAAAQFDGDLVKALRFTDSYPGKKLWKKQREAAIALADLLEGMSEKDDEEPIRPTGALYRVLNSTSYMEWLKKTTGLGEDADSSRQENVDALLVAAGEHYSIRDFLKFVDESKRLQMESDDATQILTTHRSKGGQWDVVWVSNMHDDSFPHKAAKLEGNLLPERRVAYVAFTRAKNQLKIAVPATDDKGNSVAPSRYISDAGLEITESVDSPLVLQSP